MCTTVYVILLVILFTVSCSGLPYLRRQDLDTRMRQLTKLELEIESELIEKKGDLSEASGSRSPCQLGFDDEDCWDSESGDGSDENTVESRDVQNGSGWINSCQSGDYEEDWSFSGSSGSDEDDEKSEYDSDTGTAPTSVVGIGLNVIRMLSLR